MSQICDLLEVITLKGREADVHVSMNLSETLLLAERAGAGDLAFGCRLQELQYNEDCKLTIIPPE